MNICMIGRLCRPGLRRLLSEFGWNGICSDKDAERIEQLRCGCVPILTSSAAHASRGLNRSACAGRAVGFNYASIGRSCGPELFS